MFKRNEGILDRFVRVALGLLLLPAGLIWYALQANVIALVIIGVGALGLITGLTGVCPLYIPFGISTVGKEKAFMARCMSMMAGFRRGTGGSAGSVMQSMCGSCAPSNWDNPKQQEVNESGTVSS